MTAVKYRLDLWKPTVEFAANLLPWVTGAAFFLGVGSISMIFWWWGINFLQVATPIDVLMSSLVFAVQLTPVGVGIGLGSLAHLAPSNRRWISYLASFACLGPFAYLTLFAPRADWVWTVLLMLGWLQSMALHGDPVFTKGGGNSNEDLKDFAARGRRLALTLLPVTTVGILIGAGFDIADRGFQGKPLYLKSPSSIGCQAELLWLGSENAVLRCVGSQSRVIVISSHDNLEFSGER